jgi:hypothetical protein
LFAPENRRRRRKRRGPLFHVTTAKPYSAATCTGHINTYIHVRECKMKKKRRKEKVIE